MDTEIGILYNFRMSQNIILILIYFNHLKNAKPFVARGPYKTGTGWV